MRMIDRPIRPLFPKGFKDEVQVQLMVLSADDRIDPDVVGMAAAGAALAVSPLPFMGPVATVRVGRVDGEFVINPTRSQTEYSDLDLVVAGTTKAVNMIEVGCRELSEQVRAEAIKFGHTQGVVPICEMLDELKHLVGHESTWEAPKPTSLFWTTSRAAAWDELTKAKQIPGKQERYAAVKLVYDQVIEHFCPEDKDRPEHDRNEVYEAVRGFEKPDRTPTHPQGRDSAGRSRPQGYSRNHRRGRLVAAGPRFSFVQRGETQAMVTTTLGTASDEQIIDDLVEEYSKKFLLHYNFPPFSVGEVRRIGPPGRREIGHGALAERSLEAVLTGTGRFSLHNSPGQRHPRIKRFEFDGDRLRRNVGVDGRGRADQSPGGRHFGRDGRGRRWRGTVP